MIWFRSIRDVAAELIGATTATLYPLDAQVRVTETQEVPMADAPKVVIPVEFDFTEARKQLAEFCGHDTPQRFITGILGEHVGPPPVGAFTDELRPNYHEDTRLVDIIAALLLKKHLQDHGQAVGSWANEQDHVKDSWRGYVRTALEEMNR